MHNCRQTFNLFMEEELNACPMISSVARYVSKFVLLFLIVCAFIIICCTYGIYMSLHILVYCRVVTYVSISLTCEKKMLCASMLIWAFVSSLFLFQLMKKELTIFLHTPSARLSSCTALVTARCKLWSPCTKVHARLGMNFLSISNLP